MIRGEALRSLRGSVPFTSASGPCVWITNHEDEEQALALIRTNTDPVNPLNCANCGYILRGLITPRRPECGAPFRKTEPWTCPGCGQQIEGQFTDCWKCGANRLGDKAG